MRTCLKLLLLTAVALLPIMAADAADFHVVRRFVVPGDGGWDYLAFDSEAQRLYIARSDRVQVVDPADGRLVGEVPDTPGVHGVAIVRKHGKGYTSNGRGDAIGVFDLPSLKRVTTIATPAGKNPDFILYDDASDRVIAFNGRSANATVVDPASDRLTTTIALPGRPESAVADGRGRVFVDLEDRNAIAVIDAAKGVVVDTIALAGCDEPAGLAIDRENRRLFVGCHNRRLLVVAIDGARTLATLPIGEGVDANAFDAGRGLAFSSQGDGTLTVVHATASGGFEVLQTATTARGARTMTVNAANHEVYVVSAEFDEAPAVPGQARGRRTVRPGTFTVYVLSGD